MAASLALAVTWLCWPAGPGLQAAEASKAAPGEAPLEYVTVTGTRLRTQLSEGAYPLTVVDLDDLNDSGRQSLGNFLQELTFVTGSPMNTSTSMRGAGGGLSRGISTIELRGLGPERTLVLLNGRRFVPGGNGASGVVDISMIPMTIVERIEIFKAGGSVDYGADAVAGVVNIITRGWTEGLELQAQGKVTSRGDAETWAASAAWGRQFERGSFFTALEYSDQPALGKSERDFSRQLLTVTGPDNRVVPWGSSAPPQGNFRTDLGRLTLKDGENGDSVDDFRPFTDADRFNFNPYEDLLQSSRRLSLFAQGRYELTPAFSLFGEAFLHRRDSSQQLAPLPLFTNREQDIAVDADSAYNPFGQTLTDVRRRLVEAGPRGFVQDNQAWRFVLGVEGDVRGWFWDVSLNRGRNETDQAQTGDLFDSQLRLALGPSFFDAAGTALCGTPAAPIRGCVPLNLFGGAGSITPEMLDFVGTDLYDTGYNEQTVVSANASGNPFDLPAGPAALAFGYEYRDEEAADFPDPETVRGNTTGSARAVTRGGFESHELFVELGLPLLADARLARELELEFGARWVRFSNFDARFVTEAGLHYEPLEGLQFRLAYSEAFRAPNVRELFGGLSQSNPIVNDPCADFSKLTPVEIDRCVSQGVPADGSFTQNGQETPQLGGGNPDLGPEDARTFTIGLTWEPAWLPGLTASIDYYDIRVDNGILAPGANTILEQCLATGSPDLCDRVHRDGEGNILLVDAQLQNVATETARGVDLEAYHGHEGAGGDFGHRLMISYVAERDLIAFPGADPFVGAGGYDRDNFGAIPHWRGKYNLTWEGRRWRLGYGAQWIGPVDESGGELYPGTVNPVSSRLYHDAFASFAFSPSATITGGVDNITDQDPPFFANADEANTDVATYRLLGRTWWLRLNLRID